MPNSMKSGLQLLPPSRNGCGNPRSRGRKVKSAPFHTLPWMIWGGRSTPHPPWLHHHKEPVFFLSGSLDPSKNQIWGAMRSHMHLDAWAPVYGEELSACGWLPHQHDCPPVIWGFVMLGYPGGASGKEPACQRRRCKTYGFDPYVGKIPSRRAWLPAPVFLPGETHGQRSLVGYSHESQRVRHDCTHTHIQKEKS